MVPFLNSLVWPLVETYWIVLLFLYSMGKQQTFTYQKLIQQVKRNNN